MDFTGFYLVLLIQSIKFVERLAQLIGTELFLVTQYLPGFYRAFQVFFIETTGFYWVLPSF